MNQIVRYSQQLSELARKVRTMSEAVKINDLISVANGNVAMTFCGVAGESRPAVRKKVPKVAEPFLKYMESHPEAFKASPEELAKFIPLPWLVSLFMNPEMLVLIVRLLLNAYRYLRTERRIEQAELSMLIDGVTELI